MSLRPQEISGAFVGPPESTITFQGRTYSARRGEPLAITLLAHGVYVLGRSGKYHRPRGLFCGTGNCSHCVARVDGLPNRRLCTAPVSGAHRVEVQNVVGSARFDVLGSIDWLFGGGLDHHHLMTQSVALNRVAVTMARQLAGHGQLPDANATNEFPPVRHAAPALAVVGAGSAGKAAALYTASAGFETFLIDSEDILLPHDAQTTQLQILSPCSAVGYYDDGTLVAANAQQHWRITPQVSVLATGAYEQLPARENNDLPGVMGVRAASKALDFGVLPGFRVAMVLSEHAAASVAQGAKALFERLLNAGARVFCLGFPAVAGAHTVTGELDRLKGRTQLRAITTSAGESIDVDCLIWCDNPLPAYELPRLCGVACRFLPELGAFVPVCRPDGSTDKANIYLAGEVAGRGKAEAAEHGRAVGQAVVERLRSQNVAEEAP